MSGVTNVCLCVDLSGKGRVWEEPKTAAGERQHHQTQDTTGTATGT